MRVDREPGSRWRWLLFASAALGCAILHALFFVTRAPEASSPAAAVEGGSDEAIAEPGPPGSTHPRAQVSGRPSASTSVAAELDRKRRDELRTRVYQKLGQPVPTTDVRVQPLPPSPLALDQDYIRSRIRADFVPLATQCYESLPATQSSAAGKAVFSFTIVGDESVGGIVESAELPTTSRRTSSASKRCSRLAPD